MLYLFEKLHPNHKFRWQRRGSNAKGLCCFHNDKNPSLIIYTDKMGNQRWYCFSCKVGGREVDLVQHSLNCSREAANRWLIKNGLMEETELEVKDRLKDEALQSFYEYTHTLLLKDPRATGLLAYIAGRNISKEVIDTAPIGYYPTTDEVTTWMSETGVPDELHDDFIGSAKSDEITNGGLIFFYRSTYDQWYRLKIRNPLRESEESGKLIVYLGKTHGKFSGFFSGSTECYTSDRAVTVEGEFDALSLLSVCRREDTGAVEPIYAFGGGKYIGSGINILTSSGVEDIYHFPDNDGPGLEYAFDIANEHPHTFIMYPDDYTEGSDPAEWGMTHAFAEFQEAFRKRIPAFQWIGHRLAEEFTSGTVEDQSHAKDKVLEYARKLSPTNRELFLKSYAPITGTSYDSLWEEAQAVDRIRYRKVLDMSDYGIHMGTKRKNIIEWEPISNVILEFQKDIVLDSGIEANTEPNYEIAATNENKLGDEFEALPTRFTSGPNIAEATDNRPDRYHLIRVMMPTKEKNIRVKASEYADDRKFYEILIRELGSDVWIKPKCMSYVKEAAVLLPSSTKKVEETIYCHTGWRGNKFLMPNGFIDKDGFHELGEIKVELPPESKMFKAFYMNQPPADLTFAKSIIRNDLAKVFPYKVTLPLLAHTFLAPVMNLIPQIKPYCMWVSGVTGCYKTTYTSLLASFYGNFVDGSCLETWASTHNSLEKTGFYAKDLLYVIDDFKHSTSNEKGVIQFIQSYADRHGKGRLNSDSSIKMTWSVRGCLMASGEDLVAGEASALARMIVIPIREKGDLDRIFSAQKKAKYLPGLMAAYIKYVAENIEEIRSWNSFAEVSLLSKKMKVHHERVKENFALNAFAWELMAKFLDMQDLSPQYYAGMEEQAKYMDDITQAEQASNIFIDMTKELLSSGEYYLEGARDGSSTPHRDIGAKRIGFRTKDNVHLIGSLTFAAMNKLRRDITGADLRFSPNAVYEQLITDGMLIPQSGKPSGTFKVNGQAHRVLKFKRGVVDDIDEEDNNGPEFIKSEIRFKEEPTVLN